MKKEIKKVHYTVLNDMEKYNKNFKREDFKNMNEDEAHTIFRDWYAKNLPIDLLTWSRVNEPSDQMIYKPSYWNQIILIRDKVNYIFYNDYDDFEANPVMVINTHCSKSITLPVYEINIKKYNLKMILRNNMHNWKISVISEKEINLDFMGLFDEEKNINSIYCEGFKDYEVFPEYNKCKDSFTVEMHHDDYNIYVFMYILNNYFKKIMGEDDDKSNKI